jgi:hypothetical protein
MKFEVVMARFTQITVTLHVTSGISGLNSSFRRNPQLPRSGYSTKKQMKAVNFSRTS